MKKLLLAGALLPLLMLLHPAPARAQQATVVSSCGLANAPLGFANGTITMDQTGNLCTNSAVGGPYGGKSATLLSNVNAATTGATSANWYKSSYTFACVATTWNAASAQLQYLGADGATWVNYSGAALTANGLVAVTIGANTSVRAVVTGTPTGLYCSLS